MSEIVGWCLAVFFFLAWTGRRIRCKEHSFSNAGGASPRRFVPSRN